MGRAEGGARHARIPAMWVVFGRVPWAIRERVPITSVAMRNDMKAPETIKVEEWICAHMVSLSQPSRGQRTIG
jgi:hypothetical protein